MLNNKLIPLLTIFSVAFVFYASMLSEKHLYCSLLIALYLILYIGKLQIYRYYNNVITFFVGFITFIRYFLIPLLICIDDNYLNYSPLGCGENRLFFVRGILFTIWEALFVGIFLVYKIPKWYTNIRKNTKNPYPKESTSFMFVVILLMFIIVMLYPSVLENYSYMFNLDIKEDEVEQLSPSLIENLAIMGSRVLKILLPIPFFLHFYRNYLKHKNILYFFLSAFIFVFFYALIIEGNSRNSIIIPAISVIFILNVSYPKYRKSIWVAMIAIILVISILSIIYKVFSNDVEAMVGVNQLSYWISYLELYFAGISNMGKVVTAKLEYGLTISPVILFNDLISNVPFLSILSDSTNTSQAYYFKLWGRTDQVVPSSGNGLFYFGFIIAPVVPVLIICLGHFFEKKAIKAKRLSEYVIYIFISSTVGYNIYNQVSSLTMKLTITVFPILLFICLNKKVSIVGKK